MSFPDHIRKDEARIIEGVIDGVLKRGHNISVYDGEETSLINSTDKAAIQRETAATEITYFRIFSERKAIVGYFTFIHGNGCDVIHDHSENQLCNEIFGEVEEFTDWDKYEGAA